MRTLTIITTFVLATSALAVPAWGQVDPKFEYGKADELKDVKKVEWKASVQGGLILTSGNSRTTTFSGGATASRKAGDNKLSIDLGAAYATTEIVAAIDGSGLTPPDGTITPDEISSAETTTTNTWSGKIRYDRFLSKSNSVYLAAKVGADAVAGKDLVVGGQAGYSRLLYKSASHEIASEVGYDFSHEEYAAGDSLDIHSARLFAGYKGALSATTGVDLAAELLTNVSTEETADEDIGAFKDNRFTGKLGITTKVGASVSLRFGFTAKYDSRPSPLPGIPMYVGPTRFAEKLDTITELALIVTLL